MFHENSGVKNVTITVTERVARWARLYAAKHETSVSKVVGRMLEERMNQEEGYAAAMRRDAGRQPLVLKKSGGYPTRDDIHERSGLR